MRGISIILMDGVDEWIEWTDGMSDWSIDLSIASPKPTHLPCPNQQSLPDQQSIPPSHPISPRNQHPHLNLLLMRLSLRLYHHHNAPQSVSQSDQSITQIFNPLPPSGRNSRAKKKKNIHHAYSHSPYHQSRL